MNAATPGPRLAVARAAEIAPPGGEPGPAWLVEHLWGSAAVGVVGGPPKVCKTWLALELAVAVASGRPCLGRFAVPAAGPVLLYAAEDAPLQLRERIEELCQARGARFASLPLDLILEPSLRIDRPRDLERLRATLALEPYRLLILDPYVRLQGSDENNATEVAAILATLREISRASSLALLLVHHARKSPGPSGGLSLRGSSDFYAWGDSFLHLQRRGPDLLLSVEHRAAPAPPRLVLRLAENPLRLEIREAEPQAPACASLEARILAVLEKGPHRLEPLRAAVGARKQSVLETLRTLEAAGHAVRHATAWQLAPRQHPVPGPDPYRRGNREPHRSTAHTRPSPQADLPQLDRIAPASS